MCTTEGRRKKNSGNRPTHPHINAQIHKNHAFHTQNNKKKKNKQKCTFSQCYYDFDAFDPLYNLVSCYMKIGNVQKKTEINVNTEATVEEKPVKHTKKTQQQKKSIHQNTEAF